MRHTKWYGIVCLLVAASLGVGCNYQSTGEGAEAFPLDASGDTDSDADTGSPGECPAGEELFQYQGEQRCFQTCDTKSDCPEGQPCVNSTICDDTDASDAGGTGDTGECGPGEALFDYEGEVACYETCNSDSDCPPEQTCISDTLCDDP